LAPFRAQEHPKHYKYGMIGRSRATGTYRILGHADCLGACAISGIRIIAPTASADLPAADLECG
jgi:hypothetical protein